MSRLLFSPPPSNNLPPFPDQLQADEPHRFTVINVKSHKPIVFRSSSSPAGGMQWHNLLHITPPTGVLEVPRAGLPFSSGRKHSIIHAYRFLFHHSTVCWCRCPSERGCCCGAYFLRHLRRKLKRDHRRGTQKCSKGALLRAKKKFATTTTPKRHHATLDSVLKVLTRDDGGTFPIWRGMKKHISCHY